MDEILNLNKPFDTRLKEFEDIFQNFSVFTTNSLTEHWVSYLHPILKSSGWLAFWKISRQHCDSLKISFPNMVLVQVVNINFEELEALVKIIAVQNEISLPEKHFVPLISLWPTNNQEHPILLTTSNALDIYRFFYTKMFMPWDQDDGDISKWLNERLESRLRLYFAIKNCLVPKYIAGKILDYIEQANDLLAEKNMLLTQMESENSDTTLQNLYDIEVQMELIKTEFKLLENPLTRSTILRQKQQLVSNCKEKSNTIWLIAEENKLENHIAFATEIEKHVNDSNVQFASNINFALDFCENNDTILLNQSNHYITKIAGKLYEAITIKGISNNNTSVLLNDNEESILELANKSYFENLTIKAEHSQLAILIKTDETVFLNCMFIGNMNTGITLLSGSKLELINCTFTGFSTAIKGNADCAIKLKNCKINQVENGIKIDENCSLILETVLLENCSEYGLCIEMNNSLTSVRIGEFDILNM